jgi:branched-chain amino acid transport system ATP-binding protein
LRHAHHAIVLENGNNVLEGTGDELRNHPDIKAFYLGENAFRGVGALLPI